MTATITEMRACIAALNAEAAQIEASPQLRVERQRGIAAFFEYAASQGDARLRYAVVADELNTVLGGTLTVSMLAALVGPAALTKAACKHLSEVPDGLSAKDKAERLEAIYAQRHALEVAEEAEIVRLEELGTPVQRRGDANPAIVLAITDPDAIDADDMSRSLLPSNGLVQTAQRPGEPRLPRVAHSTYMQRKDSDE
ncbi:hypothetical protein [Rhizobacter fulvus]